MKSRYLFWLGIGLMLFNISLIPVDIYMYKQPVGWILNIPAHLAAASIALLLVYAYRRRKR